ncbi:MAG TPA: NfeD family protein, partial [Candidatus Synoicihabitans sp.]|nr:NfeD family protein [Candidatus Synoicihabitans sp.]
SMTDLWPNEPFEFESAVLAQPLTNLALGLLVAIGGALAILRFLPQGWFWNRMVLSSAIGGSAAGRQATITMAGAGGVAPTLVGQRGIAATGLFPSGQVEIEGRRYEARLEVGFAEAGTAVVVRAERDFGLIVETLESAS